MGVVYSGSFRQEPGKPVAMKGQGPCVIHSIASLGGATGGPARSVPNLCTYLNRSGLRVGLFYGEAEGDGPPMLPLGRGIAVQSSPCLSLWRGRLRVAPAFGRGLEDFILGQSGQVLHDHGIWLASNRAAAATAGKLGLPLVVSPRGMLTRWSLTHHALKKKIAWQLYQKKALGAAQCIHATSRAEADDLRALGIKNPIAVVPNGTEMPPAGIRPAAKSAGSRRMLFLSRLHAKKGGSDLLNAFSRNAALAARHGWELIIAGPDENGERRKLEKLAQALGLKDRVSFLGAVEGNDKWGLLKSADLVVLPTYSENFGVVVAEALASGVPVLTTKGAPWRDLVSHRCGWWCPVGEDAVTSALKAAMNTKPEVLKAMGQRGQILARESYSWVGVAEQMKKVYAWLLGLGPMPKTVQVDRDLN
jgi:glycosyltransferase involved in cell wall biosynthesis